MRSATYSKDRDLTTDHAAAAVVSFFADHGLAFALVAMLDVLRGRRTLLHAAARLATVGIPIVLVTSISKSLVGRSRPETPQSPSPLVRTPTSSSFPSGHTLAAAASAIALPSTPLGFVLGGINVTGVGWSRLHLGAHHRSDVVGGVLIGVLLGLALRPILAAIDRNF